MVTIAFRREKKWLILDQEKIENKPHQTDPTNPTGMIRHDRQSVLWLVESARKAIVTLLWVAPPVGFSLFLSFGHGSPIDEAGRASETKEWIIERERTAMRGMEDKKKDGDSCNYLASTCARIDCNLLISLAHFFVCFD